MLLLTALVFGCAHWFARRMSSGDWVERLLDALLITFVIQYASVCLPGLVGALTPWSIAVTAVLGCALLGAVAREKPVPPRHGAQRRPEWVAIACVVFVCCYVGVLIRKQWILPPVANDPLTYHLPAAVEWLQSGRIGLYETWFYNPANTYSPLAGSAFAAWWMAPMHSEVLARFVQAPAVLLLLVAMIQFVRALGVSTTVAALIATAAVTSRPFISQAILAKDDLFVAAFFACTCAALTRVKLTDALGPWRLGLALGMLLATKYTALLGLPLLVLAIDAPARAGWRARDYVLAAICAFALAEPWYLRNTMLTGNPLYPIQIPGFEGMFATRRSDELASMSGLLKTFVTGYYSTTKPAAVMLVLCWLGALATSARLLLRTPLVRLCVLGPPVAFALFVALSPYAEVRFVLPGLLLMFACAGVLAYARKSPGTAAVIGMLVLIAGAGTGFVPRGLYEAMPTTAAVTGGVLLLAIGLYHLPDPARPRVAAVVAVVLIAVVGCVVYVHFDGFLRAPSGYVETRTKAWENTGYGKLSEAWQYIDSNAAPDATVAYTNTHYTFPLYGFGLSRRVVYVPTRAGIAHVHDLPASQRPLSGEEVVPYVAAQLTADPDRTTWTNNLAKLKPDYLLVVKSGAGAGNIVPETAFATQEPRRFQQVFANDAAVVYRIVIPTTNPSP